MRDKKRMQFKNKVKECMNIIKELKYRRDKALVQRLEETKVELSTLLNQ